MQGERAGDPAGRTGGRGVGDPSEGISCSRPGMPSGAFRGVVGPQRVSVPPAISSSGRCLPPGVPLHAHMARSQGKGSSLDAGLLGPGLSRLCQPPGPSLLFEEEGPQRLLGRGHASFVPGDHSGRLLGGLGLSFLSVFIHVFTRHVVTDHCCVCARRTEPRVPRVGTGAPVGTSPLPARPQGSLAPAGACGLGFLTQGCWWEGPNEVSRPLCIPTGLPHERHRGWGSPARHLSGAFVPHNPRGNWGEWNLARSSWKGNLSIDVRFTSERGGRPGRPPGRERAPGTRSQLPSRVPAWKRSPHGTAQGWAGHAATTPAAPRPSHPSSKCRCAKQK